MREQGRFNFAARRPDESPKFTSERLRPSSISFELVIENFFLLRLGRLGCLLASISVEEWGARAYLMNEAAGKDRQMRRLPLLLPTHREGEHK